MATKTIQIEEANALKAYKEGGAEIKKMLVNLCGDKVFNPKTLLERIPTFSDLCKEADVDESDYVVISSMTCRTKADMYMKRLMLYEYVLNGDNPINRADTSRRRFYAGHQTIPDPTAPAGFRLAFIACDLDLSLASLGARPEFNKSEHAVFVGKTAIAEYEGWAQNFQLSKTNP